MRWAPEQDAALRAVDKWLKSDRQVFRLFGYAGTGKTTLARHFAEGVSGTVLFGAYTGKAAHVLRTKGCVGAATIHSMIYHTKEKGQARMKELEAQLSTLLRELAAENYSEEYISNHPRVADLKKMVAAERKALTRPSFSVNHESIVKTASLVVIDECSMVDDDMGEDLLSLGAKVLVLGDPAQLPPVGGGGYFTENCRPDIMLTDIHRQARDNPIIELATLTRNKQPVPLGNYGSSAVVDGQNWPRERATDAALNADQVLVGRNKTRHASNRRMRLLKGIAEEDQPVPGDKLVCLRNNNDLGLLNGAIWNTLDVGHVGEDRCYLVVEPEDGGPEQTVEAHMHHFQGRAEQLPWYERKEAEEFDYGYALTVHKSQGSQWDNVLLFDESAAFRDDRWRWLYTGITRAAESIQVVRM